MRLPFSWGLLRRSSNDGITQEGRGRIFEPLTVNPPKAKFTLPEDATGHAADAIGYLHANCGACHGPGGSCYPKGMTVRLTYGELVPADGGAPSVQELGAFKNTVNVPANLGMAPGLRIAPGSTAGSAISYLTSRRELDPFAQMPPIGTHLVDPTGVALLNAWIEALPSP
jgi:hypothetical protein